MKTTIRLAASIGISAVLATSSLSAFASGDSNTYVLSALQAVSRLEMNTIADVLSNRSVGLDANDKNTSVRFDNGVTQVEIPIDARDGISMHTSTGYVTVELPFASRAMRAEKLADGLVAFDNLNGTYTAPVIKTDGSIAITSIINSVDAANRFEYRFGLPKGVRLVLDASTGAVDVVDGEGAWVAGIATPWARDARGADVPTRFEVRGNSLTQVVDTRSNTFAYPIVADPWFGMSLIQKTTWSKSLWAWSPTLMVYPTEYGRYYASTLAVSAGWVETIDKGLQSGFPNPNSPTMKVQFDCHFIFVRYRDRDKQSWNLDSKLPVTDLVTEANYGCNYPVGDAVFG
jgi:hypothetical protein